MEINIGLIDGLRSKSDIRSKLGKFKNNRLIFTIDYQITTEELTLIISSCELDFFSISTTSFQNVNDYYKIIEDIREISNKYDKVIGIIAELRGRKITVEKMKPGKNIIHLKKGQTIRIMADSGDDSLMTDENNIIVNFKDFCKLLRPRDKIIIDDNMGSLTVKEIREGSNGIASLLCQDEEYPSFTNEVFPSESLRKAYKLERLDEKFPESKGFKKVFSSIDFIDPTFTNDLCQKSPQLESVEVSPRGSENNDLFEKENVDILFDCEDYLKKVYRNNLIDSYIKTSAEMVAVKIKEKFGSQSGHSGGMTSSPAVRRKQLHKYSVKKSAKHEINCTVDYDCELNKNSFLFVPNADFKSLKIDLLTNREVAEIDRLDALGVDYISITISDMEDIRTLIGDEGVLGSASRMRIIASIPDYRSLINLNEILEYTSGVILSRTFFQTYNKQIRNSLSRITKYLIYKCRDSGRPIFAYVDVNDPKIYTSIKEQKQLSLDHDIMEGMDGFLLNVNRYHSKFDKKCGRIDHVDIINFFSNYFKSIQNSKILIELESSGSSFVTFKPNKVNIQTLILPNLLKGIDCQLEFVMVYMGDMIKNIRNISKLKILSPLIVISSNKQFLQQAQLYYSTYSVYKEILPRTRLELESIILERFNLKNRIILINNNRNLSKISVKILNHEQ